MSNISSLLVESLQLTSNISYQFEYLIDILVIIQLRYLLLLNFFSYNKSLSKEFLERRE